MATAQPGTWIDKTIGGNPYKVLQPEGYDGKTAYPVVLYLQQIDTGETAAAAIAAAGAWFNTTGFRTAHPAIIIMPLITDASTSVGTKTPGDQVVDPRVMGPLQQAFLDYSVDRTRLYVTGDRPTMWAMMLNYAAIGSGEPYLAGMTMGGTEYSAAPPDAILALAAGPLWTFGGTSNPALAQQVAQLLAGTAGASTTVSTTTVSTPWDDYFSQMQVWDWLFKQSVGAPVVVAPTPVPTPTPVTAPTPVPTGTVITGDGPDILILHMAGDALANADGTSDAAGDPAFQVTLDGQPLGGKFIATASHTAGKTQDFAFKGYFNPGAHTLIVTFLNDAYVAQNKDRNLYVSGISYIGQETGLNAIIVSSGSVNFALTGGTALPPPAFLVQVPDGQTARFIYHGKTYIVANGTVVQAPT